MHRVNKDGQTALYHAADGGHVNCMKLLLQAGATVNQTYLDGDTPLHVTADKGHFNCVLLLLQSAAHVNVINNKQHNALQSHLCGNNPDTDLAMLLYAAGDGNDTPLRHVQHPGESIRHTDEVRTKLNLHFKVSILQDLIEFAIIYL